MNSPYFRDAWEKEKKKQSILGFKNKRRNVYVGDHQTGTSVKARDIVRKALAQGKRVSKNGKVYYEYRKNRSDKPNTNL